MTPKAPKKGNANTNVEVLKSVNLWVWRLCEDAADLNVKAEARGNSAKFIKYVNREADRLVKAIRAGVRESVRELPGRAQKGEIDRLMRAIAPKLRKVLK